MDFNFLHDEYWGNSISAYLLFAVILILALLLKRYITTIFTRLFFTLFKKFSAGYYGQHFKELLLRPVEGIIVTVFLYIAFYQLSLSFDKLVLFKRIKPVKDMHEQVAAPLFTLMDLIDHLFLLTLLVYVSLLFSRILDFIFLVSINRAKQNNDKERQQIMPLLRDVLKVVVWTFGVLSILGSVFHVNVSALVAGLGVGGIAIAFAAKESLENLMASFMVMLDKPFTIGDWIRVNGVEGNIEKVGFRSTLIRTFDKSVVSIPNRKLIDENLENLSERGMRRALLNIGAVYGLSRSTLEGVIKEIKNKILNTKGTVGNPTAQLEGFGDSALNIQVVFFISVNPDVDFSAVRQEVYFGVYEIMYRHAYGFAYPTQVQLNTPSVNEVFTPPSKPE